MVGTRGGTGGGDRGGRRPRDRHGRPLPPGSRDRLGADEPAEVAATTAEAVARGVELFDRERFFEAHEFFEHVWKSDEADPPFWKAVTQVAVGCCHAQRGNRRGAVTLLERAAAVLETRPSPRAGVDGTRLAAAARELARRVAAAGEPERAGFFRMPTR